MLFKPHIKAVSPLLSLWLTSAPFLIKNSIASLNPIPEAFNRPYV